MLSGNGTAMRFQRFVNAGLDGAAHFLIRVLHRDRKMDVTVANMTKSKTMMVWPLHGQTPLYLVNVFADIADRNTDIKYLRRTIAKELFYVVADCPHGCTIAA